MLCDFCNREYQRKIYFDRHVAVCRLLSKTKRERHVETEELSDKPPTMRELYLVVMELTSKCSQLEQKVQDMSAWINRKKKKVNICEWLNAKYNCNINNYCTWVNAIVIYRENLESIFSDDYVPGMVDTIKKLLLLDDLKKPVRAFTTQDNVFYIYTLKNETSAECHWIMMDNDLFNKLMYVLDKQMMNEFVKWQKENKTKMCLDDNAMMTYAKNVKKLMGGSSSREQLYSRVKRDVYNYLKEEPPKYF